VDNAGIEAVLADDAERGFWLKPVGDPTRPVDLAAAYTGTIEFAKEPVGLAVGDVVMVSRIGVSKVMYVARCLSAPELATDAQVAEEPWRARVRWFVRTENLTPDYGRNWGRYMLKPFDLVKEYNDLYPEVPAKLDTLRRSAEIVAIPREFVAYILRRIRAF